MSLRVAFVCCMSLLVSMAVAAPAIGSETIPLPTGSYLQSCKVVSFDQSTGDLAANCEGPAVGMFGHGTPDTSTMNIRGCKEGTIWNDQRQLYCLAPTAWGNDRVIPPGSYIDTCTDRKVISGALLVAQCGTAGGESENASLDLRKCTWGRDIVNSNGTLSCDIDIHALIPERVFSGEQASGVVKPVAVEPGVVKPALVAPLAPAPGGTTGSTREDRKKKRKSERGERG